VFGLEPDWTRLGHHYRLLNQDDESTQEKRYIPALDLGELVRLTDGERHAR